VSSEEQIIYDTHVGEELDILKGPGDPQPGDVMGFDPRDAPPFEKNSSFGGPVYSAQAIEKGGLPGSVWPDDGVKLPLSDNHIDTLEGHDPPEMKGQFADFQKFHMGPVSYESQRLRRL
jgi:hypothetical protein